MSHSLTKKQAKALWIRAQKLEEPAPFGKGVKATTAAIEHLGYVQIDTISVIERSHHHTLFTRIPEYRREDLLQAQSRDKTVFEYWTHALSYIPTKDFRFFMSDMRARELNPSRWYANVKKEDLQKVLKRIKKEGPISIRDIQDDVLVEKDHEWASRKPSKRALQMAFNSGRLAISERQGMLKKYQLIDLHFDWNEKPKRAGRQEINEYLLDRSLRAQAFVSLDSICYLDKKKKPEILKLIEQRVRQATLVPLEIAGLESTKYWVRPETLAQPLRLESELVHLLSPFDPLVIQRKRMGDFFDYEHRFEAYLPKEKRTFGYFGLPVLVGDQMVAVLDLKTDRVMGELLIQKWTWLGKFKSSALKKKIEEALHRFEKFQLEI